VSEIGKDPEPIEPERAEPAPEQTAPEAAENADPAGGDTAEPVAAEEPKEKADGEAPEQAAADEPKAETVEEPPAPVPSKEPKAEAADEAPEPAAAEEPRSEATGEKPTEEKRPPKERPAKLSKAQLSALYRAYRSHRPIRGTVDRVIKGGFEVKLPHKVRGFCPHSQIDLARPGDPEQYVGQAFAFRIAQLRRGGEDVVLSRRAILEEERSEEAKAVRATLIEGALTQGRVANLAEFGAFVDLGAGVMGLAHVSELSHQRVTRVSDAVQVGDLVKVKILKLDEARDRISLSLRQAERDPWSGVAERFKPGQTYPGTVSKIADFGAFVELEAAVEALAPASEFPPSRSGWNADLEPGQSGDWLVLSVDERQRRISVTRPAGEDGIRDRSTIAEGQTLKGRVQRIEKFGVFVWLGPGAVGLMPNVLTGAPRDADLSRRFPLGDEIEVDVVEVSDDGRRYRLKKTGIEDRPDPSGRRRRPPGRDDRRADRKLDREAMAAAAEAAADGDFGTLLADKLKAALGGGDDES
jgi:small subunit ribosomal protein S1